MEIADAVGRCRGTQPASNVSMMIIRPPQHGQEWSAVCHRYRCRLIQLRRPRWLWERLLGDQLASPSDRVGLGTAAGEQAVVSDAMEPFGSTCSMKRRMNSVV
jgi:hypothetical protein